MAISGWTASATRGGEVWWTGAGRRTPARTGFRTPPSRAPGPQTGSPDLGSAEAAGHPAGAGAWGGLAGSEYDRGSVPAAWLGPEAPAPPADAAPRRGTADHRSAE